MRYIKSQILKEIAHVEKLKRNCLEGLAAKANCTGTVETLKLLLSEHNRKLTELNERFKNGQNYLV